MIIIAVTLFRNKLPGAQSSSDATYSQFYSDLAANKLTGAWPAAPAPQRLVADEQPGDGHGPELRVRIVTDDQDRWME